MYMRVLLFLLSLVNVEMLNVSDGRNPNLALNMQSLGKSHDDMGLHIFSENSIQHVSKASTVNGRDQTKGCAVARAYNTEGFLVNRYLGRVAAIGINAVSLSRWL